MRRHHEGIAALPALSLLLPFAGALWLRIVTGGKKGREAIASLREGEGDV